MKKIIFFLINSLIFANTIVLQNCPKKSLNLEKIPAKYFITVTKKAPFDTKEHKYTGITLKTLQKIIGTNKNLTFIAYDDYKVSFSSKEIKSPFILFVFLEDNKPIPLSKRGPAKIIYLIKDNKQDYFFKSIFLIKKVICEK